MTCIYLTAYLSLVISAKKYPYTGFRSSFKDWSLDDPMNRNFGELITEKCMAHQIGDEVRNTYDGN